MSGREALHLAVAVAEEHVGKVEVARRERVLLLNDLRAMSSEPRPPAFIVTVMPWLLHTAVAIERRHCHIAGEETGMQLLRPVSMLFFVLKCETTRPLVMLPEQLEPWPASAEASLNTRSSKSSSTSSCARVPWMKFFTK